MVKSIDSVKMNFTADNQANVDVEKVAEPEVASEPSKIETKEFDGKKIYERNNETGDVRWFDTDGKPVGIEVVEKLEDVSVTIPEYSATGAEREGQLEVREVQYPEHGKENVQGDRVFIAERQNYKDGTAWTCTTPKSKYQIVKFLREQNKQNGKEEEDRTDEGEEK